VLVRGFPAQAFDTNCYVVAPGPGEQCVVVDPGIGVEASSTRCCASSGLQPVAVLLTHGTSTTRSP
jgi:glyoxylase-like metal-dependent hydrolase (beta-lactamase superfamily II)